MPSQRKSSLNSIFDAGSHNPSLSPQLQVYHDMNEEETDHTYQSDLDMDAEMDMDADFQIEDQFSHFSSNSNNLKFYSEPLSSRSNSSDVPLGLTRSVGVLNLSLETKTPEPRDTNDMHSNNINDKYGKNSTNTLKRTVSKTGFNLTSPFTKNTANLTNWFNTNNARLKEPPTKIEETNLSFSEAKPDPQAFQSTGLVSKMKQTVLPKKLTIPDTPMKKSPLNSRQSEHGLIDTPMLEYSSIMSSHNQTTIPTLNDSNLFKSPPLIQTIPPSSDNSPTSSSNPRSKKRSKIVNNTELTSMLQQITDDLYGYDQDISIFSPSPSKSALQTPTKKTFDLRQHSPASSVKLRNESIFAPVAIKQRSINASIMKNPDFHLTTKFSNVSIMGKGQFSTVYQVTFPETGLKYAIKSVRPTKHNFTNRILQEINILSTLQDAVTADTEGKEYIVEFMTSWSHKGSFYIMTEFCENGNLDTFIQEHVVAKQQRLDDWRVWKIIVELCLALRFIHDSCSIVHLDLKPANILITFEGNLKVADFGMATKLASYS